MEAITKLWWRLVRFGFRLLYNEMAFSYDVVSWLVSFGAWGCWQRAALKQLDPNGGKTILELAHGTGNLQLNLIAAGYKTVGYDLSSNMGRIAQTKMERRGLTAMLVRGRAQQLPFPDATFDAVISTFPTDFIFAAETLNEINRILMNEGQLIIVPNGVLTGGGIGKALLEWLYRVTGQRGGQNSSIAAHFAHFRFEIRIDEIDCPGSIAQVIVARKKV